MRLRRGVLCAIMMFCILFCSACSKIDKSKVDEILDEFEQYVSDKVEEATEAKESHLPTEEEQIYNDAVDEFFAAVDAKDKDAIRGMFTLKVQQEDKNLNEKIEQFLEVYPGPTDLCTRDGSMVHGSYKEHYGKRSAEVDSTFMLVSNGVHYWCDFDLMYQNDFDEEQIGIVSCTLYSEDYYCALRYDDSGVEWPNTDGLSVCTDYSLDCEIRVIDKEPYKYTQLDRTITEEQVLDFLETSHKYSDFVKQFGEPNAEHIYHYYEFLGDDGKIYYMNVGDDDRKDLIYGIYLDDEFDYVRTIWKEE